MADNTKYYYLKLKEGFFNQEDLKILEGMENGHIYEIVYLKMCLLSLKNRGELIYKDLIPYDETMLATVCNSNIDNIKGALEILTKMKMIEILDNGAIFIMDIESLIGRSSDEAIRKADYRKRIEYIKNNTQKLDNLGTLSGQCPQNVPDISRTLSTITRDKDITRTREREKNSSSNINILDISNNPQVIHNSNSPPLKIPKSNHEYPKLDYNPLHYLQTCKYPESPPYRYGPKFLQACIDYMESLNCITRYNKRLDGMNIDTSILQTIIESISPYTPPQLITAIDTYAEIEKNKDKYKLFPSYTSAVTFLQKGVPRFLDRDRTLYDCLKDKNNQSVELSEEAKKFSEDAQKNFGGK